VVRSAIKAEKAVPPAAIAVPIATNTRISRPISSPLSSPPEASMLVAKRSTSWQATPNNRAIARELITMKGVRRSRLGGMRSERWPNQARVNPISC
jgi:hypothetical protein